MSHNNRIIFGVMDSLERFLILFAKCYDRYKLRIDIIRESTNHF